MGGMRSLVAGRRQRRRSAEQRLVAEKTTFDLTLIELGAVRTDGSFYAFKLETAEAGTLRLEGYVPALDTNLWVHARFDDPERAASVTDCNPYSGKWNATDASAFLCRLRQLLGRSS